MHLTWLDSNSWLIELAGQRILLDPWLVGPLQFFDNLPWFFKGYRQQDRPIPENLDLLLLSQGLPDHAHVPTLKQLDHALPVVASPNAAKLVRSLSYTQVTALAHGQTWTRGDLEIRSFPGSLVGPTTVENAYLLTDLAQGTRLYYEPHGFHSPTIKDFAPVDVVITPAVDFSMPLVGPIIKGVESAVAISEWLTPQVLLPTAAGGDVIFEGMLMSIFQFKGSAAELQTQLHDRNLPTQVLELVPGDRTEIPLKPRILA